MGYGASTLSLAKILRWIFRPPAPPALADNVTLAHGLLQQMQSHWMLQPCWFGPPYMTASTPDRSLGSEEINRLRVGVGMPGEHRSASDHVLGKFSKQEKADIEEAIWRAADAVECWAGQGLEAAMNQYN